MSAIAGSPTVAVPQAESIRASGPRTTFLVRIAEIIVVVVCLAAILSLWVTPYPPDQQELRARLLPPSAAHWLGTDQYGRDILARVLAGAQLSLLVSLTAVGIAVVAGSILGISAGYYRGRIETVLMFVVDMLLSLPPLVFALGLMAMLGAGVGNLIAAIAVAMTPNFARVLRSVALSVSTLDYVTAARSLGLSDHRILLRHVLPNCLSPIIVLASVTVARAILIESNLSFLGLGVPPTTVTWGLMANEGQQFLLDAPWVSLVPAVTIMISVLAINIVGDGLRDRLDPRTGRP